MQTSTIMTIGTALDRAMTAAIPVTLILTGYPHALSGEVVQYDGTGVVLSESIHGEDHLTVVRIEAINAVTFRQ